jgi:hypothetical protein
MSTHHYYFPEADDIPTFGPSFVRLMFACAELDRRVADIQNLITGDFSYGEKHVWSSAERPKKIRKLIRKHRRALVPVPNSRKIGAALRRAIPSCDLRNVLAHGHWWVFNSKPEAITIRRQKLRPGQKRFVRVKVARINRAEQTLRDIEATLYQLTTGIRRKNEIALLEAIGRQNPPF